MAFETIKSELREGILTITLDRPERLNAWTAEMCGELFEAFDRADADDEVRVVIVTGAGRGFCAGADLAAGGETFDYRKRSVAHSELRDNGGQFTLRVFRCTKPVIAAINGPAVGVGATMTLPMDVRLASEEARIGFVFARRGIIPEACSSWFLPRVVGISRAMEWVATGRVFSAREGLEGGLIRSVHSAQELIPAARALAAEIVENTAPVSVARARARDRPEHRARVGGARAAADVAHARRRAPDGGPPGGLARDGGARTVRGRRRGRHLVPGEAPGVLPGPRQRGPPRRDAVVARARVRVAQAAGSCCTRESSGANSSPRSRTRSSTARASNDSRSGSPACTAASSSSQASGVETVGSAAARSE